MACRLPLSPEAFYEAFANIYRDAYVQMRENDQWSNKSVDRDENLCPTVEDGLEGDVHSSVPRKDSEESSWVPWNL